MKQSEKPVVKLLGTDGNIFAVMGQCRGVLRRAGLRDQADEPEDWEGELDPC